MALGFIQISNNLRNAINEEVESLLSDEIKMIRKENKSLLELNLYRLKMIKRYQKQLGVRR